MAPKNEPIAIVGSACRFAGDINSTDDLWELLKKPRDVRTEIPIERFNVDGFYHPDPAHHGHFNVKHCYTMARDPAKFDAEFFGINPLESRAMDPQQRMTLETIYEALEAAGMPIEDLKGSDTAVFAGVMTGDYEAMLMRDFDDAPTYVAVGTSRAILSNRVSYFFDWHGASVTMDTACSSSLVAVHCAVQALRSGDSRLAVACGANMILGPENFIIESKVKMLSPDGQSRMWDKSANGYARGEGVAAILMKSLSAALEDGDDIQGIIRETGLNQDGNTAGLTMPSASAQCALIQSTYRKAGLDLQNPEDRPQFFEAHGTGTPAGDPVEAEAIATAFYSRSDTHLIQPQPLYVGSIKTVLGHTEGTAGIAAMLKSVLALQHSVLPPNLLFDELNPDVAPFYDNLEILRNAQPWPKLAPEQPRRISCNSFGFGGSNAHVILENYEPAKIEAPPTEPLFVPCVFSAASEQVLRANLSAYAEYVGKHPDLNIHDLAYSLGCRRSLFQYRLAVPGTTIAELKENLIAALESKAVAEQIKKPAKRSAASRVLAVFTGQGAQYPAMGAELIKTSPLARSIIQRLDADLQALPAQDRPSWSLEAELLADGSASRMGESAISQPLNTAIQIMLVDLLRAAGVRFDTVIGHSGGEVATAYAAGFLSARDALCVAHYRGMNCQWAKSPNGDVEGAMLAVGTDMEDALELCNDPEFAGRVSLAAVNSPSSVTISGDEDAINALAAYMEEEKKFNRRLRVDKAYHSKHMLPAAAPYLEGIRRAGVKALAPSPQLACDWYSSVFDGERVGLSHGLADVYWVENMVRPVLFQQALSAAIAASELDFDVVIEIGPHPALKSPASQLLPKSTPYQGTLQRGEHAVTSFSSSLGSLWSRLGKSKIDLQRCQAAMVGDLDYSNKLHVLPGLPAYRWNHEARHWHESRKSRHLRRRKTPVHPLLGDLSADGGAHTIKWRNVLKPSELPWLEGHSVQNQIVFPAAGYVSAAIEAGMFLAGNKSNVQLVELADFRIHQAVTFGSHDAGVEVLIELAQISQDPMGRTSAYFTFSAALSGATETDLVLAADGNITLLLGEGTPDMLPPRQNEYPHMIDVEPQRLYNYLATLEYNFTGPFCSLTKLRRKLGYARCEAHKAYTEDCASASVMIHPADLDAAMQSINLAYSYPGDEQLSTLHLPTTISKIRVNPSVFLIADQNLDHIDIDSSCHAADRSSPGAGFSGSANIYMGAEKHAAVQVDRVVFKPVGAAASDRKIFARMHYVPVKPDGTAAADDIVVTPHEKERMWVLSRIVNFYARQFDSGVPEDSPARREGSTKHYLNYIRHMRRLLEKGENRFAKSEWLNDTLEDVKAHIARLGVENDADVRIMLLVGETMPKVFRGEENMLEQFRVSGLLDEYYNTGFGTQQSGLWLSGMAKQLTDRNPHLNFLEIGAGTGGATKHILNAIGHNFTEYTFSDISASFFENAAEYFADWKDTMAFKTCDAERDPLEQGYTQQYDVIVACQVLHATKSLDVTIGNIRKLLKPGGWLLIGEGSSEGMVQYGAGFIFGTLPGWWLGVDEGRTLSPLASVEQWNSILQRNGFSGIDTMHPPKLFDTFGLTLLCSQAVDDRMSFARQPLSAKGSLTAQDVILVGGQTETVQAAMQGLEKLLLSLGAEVSHYKTLEQLDDAILQPGVAVVCMADLDQPSFKDITPTRWQGFRKLFLGEKTVLWLTHGRLADEPYCNMSVGFGRSAAHEDDSLRLQYLDIPDKSNIPTDLVAETLVRLTSAQLASETLEPEIIVDRSRRQLVPRLRYMPAANDRLHSTKRVITEEVDARKTTIKLVSGIDGDHAQQLSRFEKDATKATRSDDLELRVLRSIYAALRTPVGQYHLVIAENPGDRVRYLVLTPVLTSNLSASKELVVPVPPNAFEDATLTLVAAELVAAAFLDSMYAGQTILFHNSPAVIRRAVHDRATRKSVKAVFTSSESPASDKEEQSSMHCTYLDPFTTRSEVVQVLPSDLACLVDLSSQPDGLSATLKTVVLPHVRQESSATLFSAATTSTGSASSSKVLATLLRVASEQARLKQNDYVNFEKVALETILGSKEHRNPLAVVDWTTATSLPARVTRFDKTMLFNPHRTYWLCGLSGALGISLVDWMIHRGVRHLVLTSRNPKVDAQWVENHRRTGVTIKTLSCDVTDEDALKAVHQTIVQTLPPIVGVLNGAMVLRDVSVGNMEFDQVQDVYRPKVLGSIHLDRIFHDVNLDFFVLLSSANCIIGNVGQANYAAANMGMVAVAANRRKRGLRSSTANVGAIIGVGYITESASRLDLTVANTRLIHLNEEDFHQIFAETLEAGYLDSPDGPEVTTGILEVSLDEPNMPKWFSDPKFLHFISHRTAGGDGGRDQSADSTVQDRLQECQTEQDATIVVKEAFGAQLRRTLQISSSDDEIMALRSSDLGLDSLISVDIRSWFLKTFKVSIPVLKIMAAEAQMADLVRAAVEEMPAELAPQLSRGGQQTVTISSSSPSSERTISTRPSAEASTPASTPDNASVQGDSGSACIDWDAEVAAPENIAVLPRTRTRPENPEVVLLTGASGLLGSHLLLALLARSAIKKVICIAVRRLEDRLARGELPPASDRLEYHEGDLSVQGFGLSEDVEERVFREVDAVVHNGADTSHLKYYSSVRGANVMSTRQLISHCVARQLPLHYVSSAGMALFSGRDPFPSISGTGTGKKPAADGAHGYMCSKWACEKLLEQVNAKYGLPIWIQRPSTIVREGADASTAAAGFDWVNTLLHYSHAIRAVPHIEYNRGSFDLVYVQTCCDDIVGGVVANRPQRESGMTYLNNVNDIVIPMAQMREVLPKQKGLAEPYAVLPWEQWMEQAMAAGLHPAVAALVETFDTPDAPSYVGLARASE